MRIMISLSVLNTHQFLIDQYFEEIPDIQNFGKDLQEDSSNSGNILTEIFMRS